MYKKPLILQSVLRAGVSQCSLIYLHFGGIPKRPTGADCKSVVYDFVGSNPTPPTLYESKCGCSSAGRATAFQAVGRGFEPRHPLS